MPFDTIAPASMGGRQVAVVTHEVLPGRAVVASRAYPTDIDDLWNAITDKARIPRWFAPVEGDLTLGGKYQIKGNAGGTVTACEPPKSFALTWEFGGGISWVEVELAEAGDDSTRRRSEEHTSELQSLMRISYAVFCLKKNKRPDKNNINNLET